MKVVNAEIKYSICFKMNDVFPEKKNYLKKNIIFDYQCNNKFFFQIAH